MRAALIACVSLATVLAGCGSSTTSSSSATSSTAPSATATTSGRGFDLGDVIADVPLPVAGQPPVNGTPWYLAIGDSITFGYTVDIARSGVNSAWPLQLQSMLATAGKPWKVFDTACPSETTASYFTSCRGKRFVPFLATSSQHDVALAAIHAHLSDLRLILVALGSNDLLHAKAAGQTALQAFSTLQTNLNRIIPELKQAAPGVPIVLCNYYDPLENVDPSTVGQVSLVNGALAQLATQNHVILADFFSAINTATPPDPDLGKYVDLAHLDIHPTPLGQTRLAHAVFAVIP